MKKMLLIVCLVILGIGTASAELSDGFFCQVRSEEVIISLKKTEGFYRCNDTIASLESLIMQTAKDLMLIQGYINRGTDREYRIGIKQLKLATLEKYQIARKNIIANITTFENNIVKKSIYYFVISITPYKINLQRSLVKIGAMSGSLPSTLQSYAVLLKEQVTTIESLSKIETLPELIPLLTKYIYLKKEISGRYE